MLVFLAYNCFIIVFFACSEERLARSSSEGISMPVSRDHTGSRTMSDTCFSCMLRSRSSSVVLVFGPVIEETLAVGQDQKAKSKRSY